MAKATPQEWQQNLNWNPNNNAGDPSKGGNQGGRNDQAMYENYSREYDRIAATGNQTNLRVLNNAHGFYPGVAQGEPGPSGHHAKKKGGGGEGGGFSAEMAQLLSMYDRLLNSFIGQSAEPQASEPDGGFGFEDTVLTRRVLQDDEVRSPSLASASPQRRVMDPATGATYASPQAALAAGVTSWRYVPIGQEQEAA